jgi:hypothetical protein
LLELYHKEQQIISLIPSTRHFGGVQWYAVCPVSGQRVRVLYRPLGAKYFASRHAWSHRVAYASQFLDPIQRAWRTKEMVKARLIGDEDPDNWDLPPKPKGMRWATYERWVAKYDAAEEVLKAPLRMAAERLIKRL